MRSTQKSRRTPQAPRLTRRNAIRQSAYVPPPFSPSSQQPDDVLHLSPTDESVLEEEDDLLIGTEEAGEVEEGGTSTALSAASSFSAATVVKRSITNWRKLEFVGAGSFGRVYKAVSEDGFVFAVKEASLIGPESYAKQSASQLEQEILLLSQLEHENIVQYFGAKKEETVLSIFLEFVSEGSLVSAYEKHQMEESTVSAYTRQILTGMAYLHHHNVVHRDIKCANMFLDHNGTVKVGDFGMAKQIKVWKQKRSCVGTVYWMAPEVIRENPYGRSADIWSLGCTVLEMLIQKPPYPDEDWVSVFYQIGRGQLPPIPSSLSPLARDFILKCLRINPDDRLSADELLAHPFVAPSDQG
ncbi:hypothetical protein EJB05_20211, partial [Eragrostis curvula]